MDILRLNSLEVDCVIGDLPEEREREQRLCVDVELALDLTKAAAADDLQDSVDYSKLADDIRSRLRAAKCRLIERAAKEVMEVCMEPKRVKRVRVSVTKRESVPGLGSAEVIMERERA